MANTVLKCKYIFYGYYELPKKIKSLDDLNNNPDIESWGIKWNVLHINWKNGEVTKIDSSIPIEETNDCKYPSDKPEEYVFEKIIYQ